MIIDGKKLAEEMLEEVKTAVAARAAAAGRGTRPLRLAAVLVGSDPKLRKFLEMKEATAKRVGIDYKIYEYPETISNKELRAKITALARQSVIDGIIIELPLPSHINTQYVLNAIPQEKDPDVLSQKGQGAFFVGRSVALTPAVEAVRTILEKNNIAIRGANCAVFGYGFLIGRQVAHWLSSQGGTVTVVNEHTKDQAYYSSQADIVVSGVGKKNLITADMVKKGATVIDFGYVITDGKMSGDVDFESVSKKAGLITPVPGGVGPLVIATVLKNIILLSKHKT